MKVPAIVKTQKFRQKLRKYAPAGIVLALFAVFGVTAIIATHAATFSTAIEAETGALTGNATKTQQDQAASGQYAVAFGKSGATGGGGGGSTGTPPSSTTPCGTMTAPTTYKHVVWIWEENKDADQVSGSASFLDSLASKCGNATNVNDDATDPSLPSEPAYAAATAGSNCNTSGSGCISDDGDGHTIDRTSIFQLAKSSGGTWKSYQEGMPKNCSMSSSGSYAFKHNPAAMFTQIKSDCANLDVPIPNLSCSSSSCGAPSGAFADDIKNGSLPTFSFVTPNLDNDMHDGSIQQGDAWLKTYLTLLFDSPNYKAGDTAVFVMWDEGSSNGNGVQTIPSIIAAPAIPPGTNVSTATNNIGLLKTTQEMLGLTPLLGCAAGGSGCNAHSSVSVKTALHL